MADKGLLGALFFEGYTLADTLADALADTLADALAVAEDKGTDSKLAVARAGRRKHAVDAARNTVARIGPVERLAFSGGP